MAQVVSLTLFALLLARVLRAPPGTWRWILAGAAAAVVASQALPGGHPWRVDMIGSARTLAWLALAMVPVGLYGLWVRRLRLRTGVDRPAQAPGRPTGLVQIADDARLAADTAAALAAETEAATGVRPESLSLGWRGEDGAFLGHLRVRFEAGAARIEMLRVDPAAHGGGIGTRLLAAAEGEARSRGIRRIDVEVGSWQAPAFFTAAGYRPVREDREAGLQWLEKTLA